MAEGLGGACSLFADDPCNRLVSRVHVLPESWWSPHSIDLQQKALLWHFGCWIFLDRRSCCSTMHFARIPMLWPFQGMSDV